MSILDFPNEFFCDQLYPFLCLNDLLRLRRVCKRTKVLAEDYIHRKTKRGQAWSSEIVIGSHDGTEVTSDNTKYNCMTLRTLMKMDFHLPVNHFFFLNSADDTIWSEWNTLLRKFLRRYGRQVTHLRVSRLRAPRRLVLDYQAPLYYLLQYLEKLSHLTIDQLLMEKPESMLVDKDAIPSRKWVESVKHLHVKEYIAPTASHFLTLCGCFWGMVVNSRQLESITIPEYVDGLTPVERRRALLAIGGDLPTGGIGGITTLCKLLRRGGVPSGLKVVNCERLEHDEYHQLSFCFLELCTVMAEKSMKIVNIKAEFFDKVNLDNLQPLGLTPKKIGRCVTSLLGLNAYWFLFPMPYLEKIVLETRKSCSLESYGSHGGSCCSWKTLGVPRWPRLKTIELMVNSACMADGNCVDNLYKLLFDTPRENLTDLKLGFNMTRDSEKTPPPTSVKCITTNCSNLKKITLTAWIGTNKAISMLWKGLLSLEEVTLESCSSLGNAAFVGEDLEAPAFLCLKGLKKLSLKSIDTMLKITDTLFKLVLCQMELRELYLTCSNRNTPLTSITRAGIEALLFPSPFASTIEKFPFDTWKLSDMTEEEFHKLRDQFRSAQML